MFQIEWTSKEEEAMYLVHLHMGIIKDDKKKELSELYSRLIFRVQDTPGVTSSGRRSEELFL